MVLYNILTETAQKHPGELAVFCGDIHYSYSEFQEQVDKLAGGLIKLGISKNDKLTIIHKNCHYFLEIYFAAAKLGAVLVPVNYRLAPDDFAYILNNSRSKIVISQSEFITPIFERLEEFPMVENIILTDQYDNNYDYIEYESLFTANNRETGNGIRETNEIVEGQRSKVQNGNRESGIGNRPPPTPYSKSESRIPHPEMADIAQIYYTSGTTGRPKGVILTHKNNYVHAEWTIQELNLTSADRWLHVAPMFHLADAWAVWTLTKCGGAHVIVPSFEPQAVLEAIELHKVTLTNFIPTMLNILVNCPGTKNYDCSSLRLIMSGGAPIAPEVVRKVLEVFGCDYFQTYGLTETSPFLTMSILKDHLRSLSFKERVEYMVTTGRPFAKVQLKVVNDDGTEVRADGCEVGEIIVKGDTITQGYWELPEETSKRIVDGWLSTRDLAVINSEGYVTIVDRKDDMVITGGENVYSIEVENILYSHPDILEAAVIGLPNELWGEMVTAVVVPKSGNELSEAEVIAFCKDKLAHFKAPKKIIFVDKLPKTGSGKIYKYKLRQKLCK